MSYDQKPARMKLVSNGGRMGVPESPSAGKAVGVDQAEDASGVAQVPSQVGDGRGFPMISAILFLFGCAVGGAGLVAWPHLIGR